MTVHFLGSGATGSESGSNKIDKQGKKSGVQELGLLGRSNRAQRFLANGFTLSRSDIRLIFKMVFQWALLELKEGGVVGGDRGKTKRLQEPLRCKDSARQLANRAVADGALPQTLKNTRFGPLSPVMRHNHKFWLR